MFILSGLVSMLGVKLISLEVSFFGFVGLVVLTIGLIYTIVALVGSAYPGRTAIIVMVLASVVLIGSVTHVPTKEILPAESRVAYKTDINATRIRFYIKTEAGGIRITATGNPDIAYNLTFQGFRIPLLMEESRMQFSESMSGGVLMILVETDTANIFLEIGQGIPCEVHAITDAGGVETRIDESTLAEALTLESMAGAISIHLDNPPMLGNLSAKSLVGSIKFDGEIERSATNLSVNLESQVGGVNAFLKVSEGVGWAFTGRTSLGSIQVVADEYRVVERKDPWSITATSVNIDQAKVTIRISAKTNIGGIKLVVS